MTKIKEIHETKKHDLIIGLGGDGSISYICNALMRIEKKSRLPLLPVPAGSGNSFFKDFQIKKPFDAINRYRQGFSSFLDVIEVKELNSPSQYYCINVLGMGFISNVAINTEKMGKKLGWMSYVLSTFLTLKELKPYHTKIYDQHDQLIFESQKVYFLTFSNTKYAGGNLLLAPHASYNDGYFDVIILHDLNHWQMVHGFLATFSGKHLKYTRYCKFFQADKIKVIAEPDFYLMPDGEIKGKSPIKIELLTGQIQLAI